MRKITRLFLLTLTTILMIPLLVYANPKTGPNEPQIFNKKKVMPGGIQVDFSIVSLPKYKKDIDKVFEYTFTEIEKIAMSFNGANPNNDLKRIADAAGGKPISVNKETYTLAALAKDIAEWTKGAFDPVRGPGTYRNLKVNKKKSTVGLNKPGLSLELGDILEGFMADLFIRAAATAKIEHAFVKVNGVSRALGRASFGPWTVQITGEGQKLAKHGRRISISNYSAATVGGTSPAPVKDPRTGADLNSPLYSVTVISKEAATSQGVANSVYVLGPKAGEQLIDSLGIKAILAYHGGKMKQIGRW